MEAVLCIIFSVFAVYGLYSALRECVKFIDRISSKKNSITCEHGPSCKDDPSMGCAGCGLHFQRNSASDEKDTE